MLTAIVRFALRFPVLIVTLAVIALVYGSAALFTAKYDVFPEFVPAQAEVQAEAPGLAPEDVERLVTQPLENAINGGANITAVRSESIQGLSVVHVVFEEGTDIFRDRQLLAERVAQAAPLLPAGAKTPVLGPMTSSTMDLLKMGFTSDKLDPTTLRTLVEWTVRPRLLAVPGVARAIVFGGGRREIQIQLDPDKLKAYDVSLSDVVTAATAATGIRGAGFIDTPNQRVLLADAGVASTPEQLAQVALSQHEGANLRLGDIATVTYAPEPRFGDARVQGRPDVLLSMGSQYGANTLEVTRNVEAALAELAPMLSARGVTVFPALHRPANFIEVALRNMRDSLLLGALLVVVVLFAFLRNWRTALISFITIPLSLLIAVVVIDRIGWTINTMTLGGLAVAVGVVVDDAIIDVENILRRLRRAAAERALTAVDAIILSASIEVRRPIVLATFVVGLVFFPVLMLPGLQGSFFAPLAAAFLLATFASLLVALTLTPALALLMLGRSAQHDAEPHWVRRMKLVHHRLLERAMPHATALLVISMLAGVAAMVWSSRFGSELMPEFREGHFVAQVTAPSGMSLDEMARVGERIAQRMLAIPGVATVSQQIGRAEAGEDTWGPNRCEFHIELAPKLSATAQSRIEDALRDTLKQFPGLDSEVVTFLGDRISESISGETAAVSVNVFGPDLDVLDSVGGQVEALLKKLPNAADVQFNTEADLPTVMIRPDPARIATFGLRPIDVFDAVSVAYNGQTVAQVYQGNQALAVRVVLAASVRQEPEQIGQLLVKTPAGRSVPLAALADLQLDSGRSNVLHEAGQRRAVVTLNPTGTDVVGFVSNAKAEVARQIKLPEGVYLQWGGAAEGARAATRDLALHSTIAAVIILMLLLMAFPDKRSVGLILVNVPFSVVGGVIAVALTGASLSIGSLVGFVTLFGISARNAIMLISHYEHLVQSEGVRWSRFTALRGARERLTPILMTAVVTALGLLPLAIGAGEAGREVEGPMAIVILGGLISSTLLNLLIMPALAHRYLRLTPPAHAGVTAQERLTSTVT
jgi:CzcA family heavy metal efflux pump